MRPYTVATGLTVSMLAMFEGYRYVDYVDPVGIPTACFGHTASAAVGTQRSLIDCEDILIADVRKHQAIVLRHAKVDLNDNQLASITSFAYNVGEGNFRSSTLLSKLNAGDYIGACNELPRWVYGTVLGVKIKLGGLIKRREEERRICLSPPLFNAP